MPDLSLSFVRGLLEFYSPDSERQFQSATVETTRDEIERIARFFCEKTNRMWENDTKDWNEFLLAHKLPPLNKVGPLAAVKAVREFLRNAVEQAERIDNLVAELEEKDRIRKSLRRRALEKKANADGGKGSASARLPKEDSGESPP